MSKSTATKPIDTSKGTDAYKLATAHEADLGPRLPTGLLAALAADLTILGADPNPPPPPAAGTPAPPTLPEAMGTAVALISGFSEAILGAKAPTSLRKAYGASSKTPTKEPKAVVADGKKMLARAQANPTEALSLGILPSDVEALSRALGAVAAAEAALSGGGGATQKDQRAAKARIDDAVARIAGVGILAFATSPAVRSSFEALK